jgi:hypothetical protein
MNSRTAKLIIFSLIFALGVTAIVENFVVGGPWNSTRVLFGGILCAMALARLYITLRHES